MRFKEHMYKGYTLRFCDLPAHHTVNYLGHRVAGTRAMVQRHWKVMKDGATVTTALNLVGAKEKARKLDSKERTTECDFSLT